MDFAAWQEACRVAFDKDEPIERRIAAVRAIANNPAAAPNQLARFFTNDPQRVLRKEANALLRELGVSPLHAARLEESLAAAVGSKPLDRHLALANLAMTCGYDARIVAGYRAALGDADPEIRGRAVRGLAMLGELADVVAVAADPAPPVRVEVAAMLGYYSTLEPDQVAALHELAASSDTAVQKAARSALRRLGIRPLTSKSR